MDVTQTLIALAGHESKHRVPPPLPRHQVAALAGDPRIIQVKPAVVALTGKTEPIDRGGSAFGKIGLRLIGIAPVAQAILADKLAGEGQPARSGDFNL